VSIPAEFGQKKTCMLGCSMIRIRLPKRKLMLTLEVLSRTFSSNRVHQNKADKSNCNASPLALGWRFAVGEKN
jgi:hypothetical protein